MIPRQYESRLNKALETLSKALTKTQTFIFKTIKEADKITERENKTSSKHTKLMDVNHVIVLIDCTPYNGKHLDNGKEKENGTNLSRLQ